MHSSVTESRVSVLCTRVPAFPCVCAHAPLLQRALCANSHSAYLILPIDFSCVASVLELEEIPPAHFSYVIILPYFLSSDFV